MNLRERTRRLWDLYFNGDEDSEVQMMLDAFDPGCVIIGTGRHEMYKDMRPFAQSLHQQVAQRQDIRFEVTRFWCEQRDLTPDIALVYGGLDIRGENADQSIRVDMDSRFSMVYRRENGAWRVVHLHQSVPNVDQMEGEYYPKTLSEEVKRSRERIAELQELAETDSLTGLVNYRTFQQVFQNWRREHSWLFMLDIDGFKQVNDTFGHVTGNHVLQKLAGLLQAAVHPVDIVCRMGGDEFLLLCGGIPTEERAMEFARWLERRVRESGGGDPAWTGVSVGVSEVRPGEALETVLSRADAMLYAEKKRH